MDKGANGTVFTSLKLFVVVDEGLSYVHGGLLQVCGVIILN